MNVVFDLDGTLIDSKLRLYCLFQKLAENSNLTYEDYWNLKKKKISNEFILETYLDYKKNDIEKFNYEWMNLIESPYYLSLDKCFEGVHETLEILARYAILHICTDRQLRDSVFEQLSSLKLLPFFNQVLVTEQKAGKEVLINRHVDGCSTKDWIIGDTGKDIQVGKSLNWKTCAVLSGFLEKSVLKKYQPNLIINSVIDLSPDMIEL
jgi:phosphoglycolate phosphatase